jgi:hypothetical protein
MVNCHQHQHHLMPLASPLPAESAAFPAVPLAALQPLAASPRSAAVRAASACACAVVLLRVAGARTLMWRPLPIAKIVLLMEWIATPIAGCGVLMTQAVGPSGCSTMSAPACEAVSSCANVLHAAMGISMQLQGMRLPAVWPLAIWSGLGARKQLQMHKAA